MGKYEDYVFRSNGCSLVRWIPFNLSNSSLFLSLILHLFINSFSSLLSPWSSSSTWARPAQCSSSSSSTFSFSTSFSASFSLYLSFPFPPSCLACAPPSPSPSLPARLAVLDRPQSLSLSHSQAGLATSCSSFYGQKNAVQFVQQLLCAPFHLLLIFFHRIFFLLIFCAIILCY